MGVRGRPSLACQGAGVGVVMGCELLLGGLVSYLRGRHGVHLVLVRKRPAEGQEAGVDVELPITGEERTEEPIIRRAHTQT